MDVAKVCFDRQRKIIIEGYNALVEFFQEATDEGDEVCVDLGKLAVHESIWKRILKTEDRLFSFEEGKPINKYVLEECLHALYEAVIRITILELEDDVRDLISGHYNLNLYLADFED